MTLLAKRRVVAAIFATILVIAVNGYFILLFAGWPQKRYPNIAAQITRVMQAVWLPGSVIGMLFPLPATLSVIIITIVNWCAYYVVIVGICSFVHLVATNRGLPKE